MAEEVDTGSVASTSGADAASDEITVDDVLGAPETDEDASSASSPDPGAPARATDARVQPPVPAGDATAASAPPEATLPEGTPSTEPAPGPIPLDRHKAILENARREAAAEAARQFAWAQGLDPTRVEQGNRLYQWLESDPHGFVQWLQGKVATPGPDPLEDLLAQPALRAEDGTQAYSAEQVNAAVERAQRTILAQVQDLLNPVTEQMRRTEAERFEQRLTRQASQQVEAARSKWPLFKELEPAIKTRMGQDPSLSFAEAYIAVFGEQGPGKLQDQWKAQSHAVMADKAAAATARPGSSPATPRDYRQMTPEEIAAEVFSDAERG